MGFWDNIHLLRSLSHQLVWVAITLGLLTTGVAGIKAYIDRRIAELDREIQRNDIQRERNRIKSLEMHVTLFLTSENNLLSDVAIIQTLTHTPEFMLILSKVDKLSPRPDPKEKIQLISKTFLGPSPIQDQDNEQDFSRYRPYKVVSVSQLVDASDTRIIGKSVEALSDFNQLIMRSARYHQPAEETPQSDNIAFTISSFWYSIKKVHLQLIINGVSVNDMTAEFPRFSYASQDSTYYWWKSIAVEALFQDVKSRYEQASFFQNDSEGRTTENNQVR